MRASCLSLIGRSASLLLVGLSAIAVAQAAEPPRLDVLLSPHSTGGAIDRLAVQMRLQAPNVAAGQVLLRMPLLLASTPTAAYEANAIQATDDKGPLALVAADEAPTPTGRYRVFKAERSSVGDVEVRYQTPPRAVDAETRNGPLFDLRSESGGALGAGVYFFAIPPGDQPQRIDLKWDLSQLPPGSRGVWSFGEGEQIRVAPADTLQFTFYAFGPLKSEPKEGSGNFNLYWLAPPPFDMLKLARDTRTLHDYMSKFFHDGSSSYRVFARANPYPAGGGTALHESFMFGYGAGGESAAGTDLQMLIAHEMSHNWPRLDDKDKHAETAWYTEGTAEYYSSALSYRAKVIDVAKFLKVVNSRADGYYTNPFIALSNSASGEKFWSDYRAQRVPYGRGFMYFVRTDALIRARSGGKRSVDDLVLEMQDRQTRGEPGGLDQWREMVARELGEAGVKDYDDMVAGKMVIPPPNAFAPCLRAVQVKERPFELGFDEMRLAVVSGLRPNSAAADAGLADGDKITSLSKLNDVKSDEAMPLNMTVKRGDKTLNFSFLPRGTPVDGWRWERVPGIADERCKF